MARWRRTLLVTIAWLAIVEGGAWIADAALGFRYALLDGIETARASREPIAISDPDWPSRAVRVRTPDQYEARAEPYTIGGHVVPDAWPDAKQGWLYPEDLQGDPRTRVVVLGESAALGFPYRHEDTFERQLERARPDLRVINAGQAGWASGRIVGAARRALAQLEPDVLVVYAGNNEWIQWSPGASARDLDVQRALATSRALAAALYLGHEREIAQPRPEPPLLGWEHALAHPAASHDHAAWLRDRRGFLDAFREHLAIIRDEARARGVRVLFCTVPFRYRLAPDFKHPQPDATAHHAEVRALEQRIAAALRGGRPDLALVDRAIALDPEPAILHHLRGATLEALGRPREAEDAYAEARDRMVGNLGGRLAVNEVIREVAGDDLVDLRALFDDDAHARGAFLGDGLIEDDCHPTVRGHRLIAEALADRL